MDSKILELAAGIVASYVENNKLSSNDIPNLIKSVHAALSGTTAPEAPAEEPSVRLTPAQIRKSIQPDYLVSFLDGKRYKAPKRHLSTHGLTFPEYRERFGLPSDYPTVSPNYSAQRSEMAKAIGLGAKGRGAAPVAPVAVAPPPAPEPVVEAAAPKAAKAKAPRAKKATASAGSNRKSLARDRRGFFIPNATNQRILAR